MGSCRPQQGSGRRSPNCVSKVSSLLDANQRDLTPLDFFSVVAEKVARMRMMEEVLRHYSSNNISGVERLFVPPRKLSTALVPPKNPNRGSRFFTDNTHHSFEHLQATQSWNFQVMDGKWWAHFFGAG
ncbi:putative ovule protein [Abeliophyllum distichum]|uniref:Ovule protein n=1 Tax=Abeliophyllum distichum TaxID=126358 RepID=A0ABD1V440_9LAMI